MRELLAPVFVQIALTFILMFATAGSRVGALRRREVKVRDIALGQSAWPARATQIGRSFQNQFELPLLFYLAVVLALITGVGAAPFSALAWTFVASRYVHALIHTTSNVVTHRFYAFVFGSMVLVAMWGLLAVRILGAAGLHR